MSAARGRPDATGRSSGKVGGRKGKMMKPPQGEPWVWLTAEIIASDAWRSLSINARRFIDALQLDHMAHAGTENGNLMATHRQLEAIGMARNKIRPAIEECETKGLVRANRGGMRVATRYRLTWLPDKFWNPATNEWRHFQIQKSARTSEGSKPAQVRADEANLPAQIRADAARTSAVPSISRMGITHSLQTRQTTDFEALRSISAAAGNRFHGIMAIQGLDYMGLYDRAMARRSANAA